MTEQIIPQVWCSRVIDEISWRVKEDSTWIHWAKCMRETCDSYFEHASSLKSARQFLNLDDDFQRVVSYNGNWTNSTANSSSGLCESYPNSLLLPNALSESEIREAASERSKSRLPVLVWLHPLNNTPLCRSAQPRAGMSGTSVEADKKLCLAYKFACPSGLPLRIADARPRLNANANALQVSASKSIHYVDNFLSVFFLNIYNIIPI